MYQDPYFSQDLIEELSEMPQIPFPEPVQPAAPDALQHPLPIPVPTPIQLQPTTIPDSPQLSFPAPVQPINTPSSSQQPFPMPVQPTSIPSSSQQPISAQSPTSYDYRKSTFSQQLPSVEATDSTQIPFLQPLAPPEATNETAKATETAQTFFPQHISPEDAATPPPSFQAAQTSGANIQMPFAAQPLQAQMPGFVEVPITTQGLPAASDTSQYLQAAPSNQQAKRAIINGVISLVVSTFTFLTIAGFAGLVIGTFAIIYGLMGLRLAWHLPNKAGRGQAIIGIALGLIAWCIVIAASIFRAPLSS